MTIIADFEITGWDEEPYEADAPGPALAQTTVRKRFSGGMQGTSVTRLLTAQGAGGAGYVASERVQATIDGRSGTFVLQHGGIGDPAAEPFQFGLVVPGSGTGGLEGIAGSGRYEHTGDVARLTLDVTL